MITSTNCGHLSKNFAFYVLIFFTSSLAFVFLFNANPFQNYKYSTAAMMNQLFLVLLLTLIPILLLHMDFIIRKLESIRDTKVNEGQKVPHEEKKTFEDKAIQVDITELSSIANQLDQSTPINSPTKETSSKRIFRRFSRSSPKLFTPTQQVGSPNIKMGHFCKRGPVHESGKNGFSKQTPIFAASFPLDKRQKTAFAENNLMGHTRLTLQRTINSRRFSQESCIPSIRVSFSSSRDPVATPPVPFSPIGNFTSPKTQTPEPLIPDIQTPKSTRSACTPINEVDNFINKFSGDIYVESSFESSPTRQFGAPPGSKFARRASLQQWSRKKPQKKKISSKKRKIIRKSSLKFPKLQSEDEKKKLKKQKSFEQGENPGRKLSLTVSVANPSFNNTTITQSASFQFVDFPTNKIESPKPTKFQANIIAKEESSSSSSSSSTSTSSASSSSSSDEEKHNRLHRKQSSSSYEGVIFSFKFGSQSQYSANFFVSFSHIFLTKLTKTTTDDSYQEDYGLDDHLHDQKLYSYEIKKRGHHYQNLNSALDAQYFRCKKLQK